jgi:hypothetical protein
MQKLRKSAAMLLVAVSLGLAGTSVAQWSSGGYRIGAICNDGTQSSATGSGACSWHGGVINDPGWA